jgi:fructosamine-3-kinase
MSMGEIDISWDSLRRIVKDWAGESAELAEFRPLHGGCINTTLALTLADGAKAVVKISPHRVDRAYEREAIHLTMMRGAGIPAPEVYRWKIGSLDDPISYLLIEFIDGVDLAEAKSRCTPDEFDALQRDLADIVARMHANKNQRYMRIMEESDTHENWGRFFRQIYDPIWQETEKSPLLPKGCRKQISKIHEKLERLLAHNDCPRLVHWDLWSTNILCKPDASGQWHVQALVDPSCKYAHAEAELAYLELFQTVTPAFMKEYQQRLHKLPVEYHQWRKPIYQLYPLIDHVHLFGAEYVKPLSAMLEKCAHLV